jgi:hypothetical protein
VNSLSKKADVVTIYRDTPCKTCGWKFKGFHVCVDPKAPIDPKIMAKHASGYKGTLAERQRLREAVNERWERYREETAERDAEIIRRYKQDDVSMKQLAQDFGIAFQTLRGILIRAEQRNELTIRPPGTNVRFKRGYVS